MMHCPTPKDTVSTWRRSSVAYAAALMLTACGGGGGGETPAPPPPPPPPPPPAVLAVSAISTSVPSYSKKLDITVTGTKLTDGISVASPGCTGLVPHPTLVAADATTTAYYQCTTKAMGTFNFNVTKTSDASLLRAGPYTVPAPQVTLKITNGLAAVGDVVVTLTPDKTPLTVDNFLRYVNEGYYDGLVFHRLSVSTSFGIAQAGAFTPFVQGDLLTPKSTYAPINLEASTGISNRKYTISMARTTAENSATSQFYLNLIDNSAVLDATTGRAGYAAFGTVDSGTATVDAIAAAPKRSFFMDIPNTNPPVRYINLPCTAPEFECAPSPMIVITTARQTR